MAIALVAIGMIFFFSGSIREFLNNLFNPGGGTNGGEIIESSSFSVSQVKTFIKACWDKYQNVPYQKTVVCYVLKGDVSGVDPNSLPDALGPGKPVDITSFDNTKSMTIIKNTGNKILVES